MHDHHHEIHLGAAWEPPAPAAADGRRVWTRRFGRPAGLEPGDRVLFVVTGPAVAAEIAVNAVRLPPLLAGTHRWAEDITPLLRDRNELAVDLTAAVDVTAAVAVTAAIAVTAASTIEHVPARGPHGRGPLPSAIGIVALEIVAADHVVRGPARA